MKIRALFAVFMLFTISLPASGEDVIFVPSIGYGMSDFKFSHSGGGQDSSRFNIIDVGLTAAYKRFYIRGYAEIPLGEEYTYGPAVIRQVKREDYGYSIGYYLLENLSVFGGYSYGKTSITSFDGSVGPYPVYTQHVDSGMYIGANYSFYVGKSGTIGINLAFADMIGELVIEDTDPAGSSSVEEGKTSGFSLGLTWSDTYKDKVTYYAAYKKKSYKTDLTTTSIDKGFNIFTFGFVFPI